MSAAVALGMAFVLASAPARAAGPRPADPAAAILGTWRGMSLCTNRRVAPACRDEQVIYHIRRAAGDPPGGVTVSADKVVAGKVVPMYELDCTADSLGTTWSSEFRNARVHVRWSYVLHGRQIEGTLVDLPTGEVVRRVWVWRDPVAAR